MTPLVAHPSGKVLSLDELLRRFAPPRSETLVFTNGCFDLLHRGHVEYLHEARALGDILIVGVNADASVKRLKGPRRPLVSEADRALIVASLAFVDGVVLFADDTPRSLVSRLLPDVLVKGGDYEPEEVAGREEVLAAGGRLSILPFVQGYSTTEMIERAARAATEVEEEGS